MVSPLVTLAHHFRCLPDGIMGIGLGNFGGHRSSLAGVLSLGAGPRIRGGLPARRCGGSVLGWLGRWRGPKIYRVWCRVRASGASSLRRLAI